MSQLASLAALAALIPAMSGGPLGAGEAAPDAPITLLLCRGGSIELPTREGAPERPAPDCVKGCHAGERRRSVDRRQ